MMLYKNTEVIKRSSDGDTDFFDIVSGVLHGDTVEPFSLTICPNYALQTVIDLMEENDSHKKHKKQLISHSDIN